MLHLQKKDSITNVLEGDEQMREEYDFSKGVKNPYSKRLKKQITINLNVDTIEYFKAMSEQTGIPYQTLINLYLSDCAEKKKKTQLQWG